MRFPRQERDIDVPRLLDSRLLDPCKYKYCTHVQSISMRGESYRIRGLSDGSTRDYKRTL